MTATLHDLLKSYREGGVFPSYDQLAAIAGQDQGGAAVRGEAVAEFNINDMMMVTLTPEGAAVWNQRYANLPLPADLIPEKVDAGYVLKDQLWDLMEVFGPHTGLGRPAMFVGMRMAHTKPVAAIVSARAADAPSEPSEPQQKTIDCMDAWATSMQMPTYSELHALTEQYDALIRKICFQYAAGGYNSDGFMAPKSADLKLRWIIDEAYKAQSRAADALDSQPTEPEGCEVCLHTYCMTNEKCSHCGHVAESQGWKGGRQPTDGGVRNG